MSRAVRVVPLRTGALRGHRTTDPPADAVHVTLEAPLATL